MAPLPSPGLRNRTALALLALLFHSARGLVAGSLDTSLEGKSQAATRTPTGLALSGAGDGSVKVWDLRSRALLRREQGHGEVVEAAAADFRQGKALTGARDGIIQLWDLKNGTSLRKLQHGDGVWTLAADFARERALSAGEDHHLRLWDLATGERIRTFKGHELGVMGLAADFDKELALTGSYDGTLKLWNLSSGECLRTLKGHDDHVEAVAVDRGFRYAISGSRDKTIKVWDLGSGKILTTLYGHEDAIWALKADFARGRALSASADNTVKLWRLDGGRAIRTLRGHRDGAISLAADFGRNLAVSGSNDGTMKLWDLKSGKCLRTLETGSPVWSLAVDFALSTSASCDDVADTASGSCPKGFAPAPWGACCEGFRFDCLAGAKLKWRPKHRLFLAAGEQRPSTEEVSAELRVAHSHSTSEVPEGLLAGSCTSADALAPLCRGLGVGADGALRGFFGDEEEEDEEDDDEEEQPIYLERGAGAGNATRRAPERTDRGALRAVTMRTAVCKHSFAAEKPQQLMAWQLGLRLNYSHRVLGRRLHFALELQAPGLVYAPYALDGDQMPIPPGPEFGAVPTKSDENACFSQDAVEAIAGLLESASCN